jgi:hypothetical protein
MNSLLVGAAAGGLPADPPSIQALTALSSSLGSTILDRKSERTDPTQTYMARIRGRMLGPP